MPPFRINIQTPRDFHITLSKLETPACLLEFDDFMLIYQDSIEVSEQQTPEELLSFADAKQHVFSFIKNRDGVVMGGAIFWVNGALNIGVLVYIAIDKNYRSLGLGDLLLSHSINVIEDRFKTEHIIIEVDSTREKSAADLDVRIRRKNFYARAGAKTVSGFQYWLPLQGADYYPEMELMLRTTMDSVDSCTLEKWVRALYIGVYKEGPTHPLIQNIFKESPLAWPLSTTV